VETRVARGGLKIGLFTIVAYHPREGMEAELREAIRDHLEVLGAEGLVTSRAPYVMRSQDGAYLEAFEWKSADSIAAAHHNAVVGALWGRFERACEYRRLCDLAESREMFAGFEGWRCRGVGGEHLRGRCFSSRLARSTREFAG
jgi:hypothetical protein